MNNFIKNKIASFFIIVFASWMLASCSQVIIGGATSTSMIIVQERSPKQAAIDILIKAKIEEAMFSNNYDKLFSKVRVIVYEGRVLLVGTVAEEKMKEKANQLSWNTKNVKEVLFLIFHAMHFYKSRFPKLTFNLGSLDSLVLSKIDKTPENVSIDSILFKYPFEGYKQAFTKFSASFLLLTIGHIIP